jgi:type IV pilus assembly protein PilE
MGKGNAGERPSGFTLIELMIVLVVIAILTTIAYPSYADYLRKGRRADAKAALLELAQQVERHYTTTNAYTGVTLDVGVRNRVSAYYTVGFATGFPTTTAYTLQAVPVAGSSQASDSCGTLTITHTGARTPSTTGCWN